MDQSLYTAGIYYHTPYMYIAYFHKKVVLLTVFALVVLRLLFYVGPVSFIQRLLVHVQNTTFSL